MLNRKNNVVLYCSTIYNYFGKCTINIAPKNFVLEKQVVLLNSK